MSYTSNQINSQSLNGIISLSDGVLNIEDGIISNIQSLNVIGNTELDGDLVVDGKITCAYNALLPSDVVNKNYVDDALNNNSRFLRVDGTNKMNANLNVGNKYIYNVLDPLNDQDASTKFYTDKGDNLRLLKSGGSMTGDINFNSLYGLNNIPSIQSETSLNFINNATSVMQIQSNRILTNIPINISLTALSSGIIMNNTKIISCNSIAGNSNIDLILNYLSGTTILPKINLTSTQTLITDGLKMNNLGIDMSGNSITNLPAGSSNTDCVNKLQMDTADNLRFLKSGGILSGNLDMSGNNIININNLASATSTYLHLLIGNTIFIQLTPEQVIFRAPILINNIAVGGTGIYMAGTKIANLYDATNQQDAINKQQMDAADNLRLKLDGTSAMTGALNMNSNFITNAPSIGAGSTISLKIATLTIMQIQDLKVLMSKPIDMGGNTITNVASVSSPTATSLNLQIGTSPMLQLTSVNSIFSTPIEFNFGSPNIGINMVGTRINACSSITGFSNTNFVMNYWGTSVLPKITLTSGRTLITDGLKISNVGIDMSGNTISNLSNGSSAGDAVNKSQLDLKLNLAGGTLSNTLTFSGGGIDMGGYDITKVSNINSNGTNALNLQHNSTTKVKIDSSGIVMQNSANLDMNNGSISNTALTTPKITAPIQTTTSSSYSFINNSYLNIGYTVSNSYNIYTTMTQTTYYALLGANNRITVDAGVWIITGSFNPFCISGTPDTQAIHMIVSNVNSATEWNAYPSSKVRQMFNGQANSNDSCYIVNTFVITLTAQTYLYLWGYVQYSGSVAWAYDFAELRATRIA